MIPVGQVSIVVPTKDRRQRLERTLHTLLAQDYDDIEIVISDDGSSDNTGDFIRELDDDRITMVRAETPTGVSNARNRGVAAASGQFIAFCDDDDLWLPTKISAQIEAMGTTSAAWAACGAVHTGDDLRPVHSSKFPTAEKIEREIAHVNPIPGGCSSVLVQRDALDAVGQFDPDLSMFADWDLWLRLYVAHGQPAIVDQYLVLYLVHDGQMTRELANLTHELDAFRAKHRDVRDQLYRPRVDGVDWWVIQSMRAAGRWRDAAKFALTGASSRNPLALRELRRPLFKRHKSTGPFSANTPEQIHEETIVQAACAEMRALLDVAPEADR